ncbi:MAG: glycosyltransferase [Casimicrobiaceae bacterium]
MDEALRLQQRGETAAAAGLYLDVLAVGPATHDALHMLGVIELASGHPRDAECLIREAMALRPPYAAIVNNLKLAVDAARSQADHDGQQGFGPRLRALLAPAIADPAARLAAAGEAAPTGRAALADTLCMDVFEQSLYPCDDEGDHWFAGRLAQLFPSRIRLRPATDGSAGRRRASRVAPAGAAASGPSTLPPRTPVMIVGATSDTGLRLDALQPERIIVLCTSGAMGSYAAMIRRLHAATGARIELAFRSTAVRERFALPGHVVIPPVELSEGRGKVPGAKRSTADPFVVGYVAPREESVVPPSRPELWRALSESGVRVRLRGANRLRQALGAARGIEIRSRHRESLASFLADLDCLVYEVWRPEEEGWGIELFTAMALGIPVLCSTRSCYAVYVSHGRQGFVSRDDGDVLRIVAELRNSTELVARTGAAGRVFATAELSVESLRRGYRCLMGP